MGLFGRKKVDQALEEALEKYPPIGGVMVANSVMVDKQAPGLVVRSKPINEQDSGWMVSTGLESQEYMDDADNFAIYNPTTLIRIEFELGALFLNGVGAAFERSEDGKEWVPIYDFPFEDDVLVKHRLSTAWVITISDLFLRRQEEEGDIVYTAYGRTVRLALWYQKERSLKSLYNQHLAIPDESSSEVLERFDFYEEERAGVAYIIEESDENKAYSVLYFFTLVNEKICQGAVYFDRAEDKQWAIDTWKSIVPQPQ